MSTNPLDLHVDVVTEDGQWSMVFAGLPIAGKGGTLPNLVEDTIAALQEYAQDWIDELHAAPDHEGNSELVRFVTQSTDEELQGWLLGFVGRRWGDIPWGQIQVVRTSRPDELGLLLAIEEEADSLYSEVGIGPFASDDSEDHLARAAVVLVAGDPPVGFASVEVVDNQAHVWQLSVRPSAGRRGVGTALMTAVLDWAAAEGYDAVTLTTYRDVPWNGPFYRRLGFQTLDQLTPGLAAIREHEKAIGDDNFGPRIAMQKGLTHHLGTDLLP